MAERLGIGCGRIDGIDRQLAVVDVERTGEGVAAGQDEIAVAEDAQRRAGTADDAGNRDPARAVEADGVSATADATGGPAGAQREQRGG